MLRKFSSERIFDGFRWLPEGSVLITEASGKIVDIGNVSDVGEGVEYFSEILCPGFINCHVHLELSHMKNKIQAGNGLVSFLLDVIKTRAAEPQDILDAMISAEKEMWANGIVAAGDICNTAESIPVKESSEISWVNFIEVINLNDGKTADVLQHYSEIRDKFIESEKKSSGLLRSALVPHSPYSVSPLTFKAINEHSSGEIISMHSQESDAENELYITGSGDFLRLYNHFGLTNSPLPVTGTTTLQSLLPILNRPEQIILVHNTFITGSDINFISHLSEEKRSHYFFCLCPNANLYIENKLPPVQEMMDAGLQLVVGTDSYSSNYQLSIAAELKTLAGIYPQTDLSVFLTWATSNGARALGLENKLGSFSKNTHPGIVGIDNDFNSRRII